MALLLVGFFSVGYSSNNNIVHLAVNWAMFVAGMVVRRQLFRNLVCKCSSNSPIIVQQRK